MGDYIMKVRVLGAAAVAATVLGGSTAFAADLGGNCCADLEERIAELEATTARKGNRKVSLTITGWVSSQLFWFDDGRESNVYVTDNHDDLSSNVKFTGSAQIAPGWKAGYSLWLYTSPSGSAASSLTANDTTTTRGTSGISIENSYWFIQSDTLGKVSVGKQSLAADNAALGTDFSGTLFPANNVTFDGGFLHLVNSATGNYTSERQLWEAAGFWCEQAGIGIGNDCAGGRLSGVRYDTPTFAGFTLSASWGEDDYWDVAVRYAGEFSGFKVAAAVAYSESTDQDILNTNGGAPLTNDNQYFQVGGMIKHLASGLWVHGTYGQNWIDNGPVYNLATQCGGLACPDSITGWYIKGGWSTKLTALGATHFYGEYGQNEDAFQRGATLEGNAILSADATRFGAGVVQEIDAAAMSLWAKWRHHEYDATTTAGAFSAENVDMFLAGAVIFY